MDPGMFKHNEHICIGYNTIFCYLSVLDWRFSLNLLHFLSESKKGKVSQFDLVYIFSWVGHLLKICLAYKWLQIFRLLKCVVFFTWAINKLEFINYHKIITLMDFPKLCIKNSTSKLQIGILTTNSDLIVT